MKEPLYLDVKDSGCLRFETQNDAIDHARYLADRGHKWFAGETAGIIERYRSGDCYLSLRGLRRGSAVDFAFRLFLVPNNSDAIENEVTCGGCYPYACEINAYGQDTLMFCWIGNEQKRSQNVVPAPIGAQIDQVIMNLARNAPIRTSTRLELTTKMGFRLGGGECRVLRLEASEHNRGSVRGLVQGTSKITYQVNRVSLQGVGDTAKVSGLLNDFAGLTLFVSEVFHLAFFEKGHAPRLEFREIATRSVNE